jgi:hypothetical protein
VWGAAWLLKATKLPNYWNYIKQNIHNVKNYGEFGWDSKDAGINVLISKVCFYNIGYYFFCYAPNFLHCFNIFVLFFYHKQLLVNNPASKPFNLNADKFICAVLPESPLVSVSYSRGNLLFIIN